MAWSIYIHLHVFILEVANSFVYLKWNQDCSWCRLLEFVLRRALACLNIRHLCNGAKDTTWRCTDSMAVSLAYHHWNCWTSYKDNPREIQQDKLWSSTKARITRLRAPSSTIITVAPCLSKQLTETKSNQIISNPKLGSVSPWCLSAPRSFPLRLGHGSRAAPRPQGDGKGSAGREKMARRSQTASHFRVAVKTGLHGAGILKSSGLLMFVTVILNHLPFFCGIDQPIVDNPKRRLCLWWAMSCPIVCWAQTTAQTLGLFVWLPCLDQSWSLIKNSRTEQLRHLKDPNHSEGLSHRSHDIPSVVFHFGSTRRSAENSNPTSGGKAEQHVQ